MTDEKPRTDQEVRAIVRDVLANEGVGLIRTVVESETRAFKERESRLWDAIGDLQSVATRLETVAQFHEAAHKEAMARDRKYQEDLTKVRIDQAKNAGIWGGLAGAVVGGLSQLIQILVSQG